MIVKVQRSLYNSNGDNMMLIYNEDKSVFIERPLTEAIEKALGGRPKAYFKIENIDDEGKMIDLKETGEQDW